MEESKSIAGVAPLGEEGNTVIVLLHSSRAINVATVICGALAGLYGFNSILGKRSGVLRQLIVALPAAGVFGLAGYLGNIWANHLYSTILQEAFQLPTGIDPSYIVGAQSAAIGFLTPFLVPNLYRSKEAYDKPSISRFALYILSQFGLLWFTYLTELLFLQAHDKIPFDLHFSRTAIIAGSGVAAAGYALLTAQISWRTPSQAQAQPQESGRAEKLWPLTCLISLVIAAVSVALFIPLFSLTGWGILLYFLLLFAAGVVVAIFQLIADNLPQDKLLYISLFFFLGAAGLQIYQAVAL
jgi:hypothetical protein